MRLTQSQLLLIKQNTIRLYGNNASVYLFGSRINDNAKGGDIDLFIETDKKTTLFDKLQLMTQLQIALGDRKIDIIVKDTSSKHRSIFDTAKNEGILL